MRCSPRPCAAQGDGHLTQAERLARAVGRHGIPVLIIHGASDALVPAANSRRLAALLPNAEVRTPCGHGRAAGGAFGGWCRAAGAAMRWRRLLRVPAQGPSYVHMLRSNPRTAGAHTRGRPALTPAVPAASLPGAAGGV